MSDDTPRTILRLNPLGQRGKYSIQAFNPVPVPCIYEIGTTDNLVLAEQVAQLRAVGEIETKIIEKTDKHSNIGTFRGVWFEGERRSGT